MYDLTDFTSYKRYFETIAQQHVQIDDFKYGDQEVQNNEVRQWGGKRLWLWPYGMVRVEDNLSDNYLQRKEGVLFVGGSAPKKFDDEDEFVASCEGICKDIISRMIKDRADQILVTRINGYSYEKVVIQQSTRIVGCELRFNFTDPNGFTYDPLKWDTDGD